MKIGRPSYERNHLWRCRTRSCYRFGPGPDQHTDEDDGYSYFLTHDGSIKSLRTVVETCGHNTTRSIVLPAEYLGMVGNRDGLIDGRAFHDMMAAMQKERDAMIKRDDAVKGNDPKTDNDLIRGDSMNTHDGGEDVSLCRRIHEGRPFWVDCMTQRIAGPDDACDLYVYEDDAGWVCDRCPIGPNVERIDRYPSVYMRTDLELLAHLHRHRQAGHRFPRFMESFVKDEMT